MEIDSTAQGMVKAGGFGVQSVGLINSYVTVTAGASRVVAVVTGVRILPEHERSAADGPYDASQTVRRTIEASMIGRIVGGNFRPGVAAYPSLLSPVSVATDNDLDVIYKRRPGTLRFGRTVISPDHSVWLDADRLLARHFAILGMTGSGKSCSVLALLDSLHELENVDQSNVIIFDANGEYGTAFEPTSERATRISSFRFGPDLGLGGLNVPLWFMNSEEHVELLRAAEGVQAPLLQRSIIDARMAGRLHSDLLVRLGVIRQSLEIISKVALSENKAQEKVSEQLSGLKLCLESYCEANDALRSYWQEMCNVLEDITELGLDKSSWNPLDAQQLDGLGHISTELRQIHSRAISSIGESSSLAPLDFDAPSHYSYSDLTTYFLPQRVALESTSDPRLGQYVSTLQMRMTRLLSDDRYSFMTRVEPFDEALGRFLRLLLGKDPLGQATGNDPPWKSVYAETDSSSAARHSVTILDLSFVASDVLPTVAALIARLVLELAQRMRPRASMPILMILEEAHRYVTREKQEQRSQAAITFERIAKEGRKFGVSLCLASQRPSDLDPTVLSQCGTAIVHRISSQVDQDIIRAATPMASRDVLRQLPSLATQHAIVLGEAVPSPTVAIIRTVEDLPDSQDPSFIYQWSSMNVNEEARQIARIAKAWERGERVDQVDPSEKPSAGPDDV